MLGSANAGPVWGAKTQRRGAPSRGAGAQARGVVHQLVEAGIEEPHELDLADRPKALGGHADAQTADQQFGKRRVDDAPGAEALLQALRRAKHAAVDADV